MEGSGPPVEVRACQIAERVFDTCGQEERVETWGPVFRIGDGVEEVPRPLVQRANNWSWSSMAALSATMP